MSFAFAFPFSFLYCIFKHIFASEHFLGVQRTLFPKLLSIQQQKNISDGKTFSFVKADHGCSAIQDSRDCVKYSLSLGTQKPHILCDLEFNIPLFQCQDGKRLSLHTNKVKFQASLFIVNICKPQVPLHLFVQFWKQKDRLVMRGAGAQLSSFPVPGLHCKHSTAASLFCEDHTPMSIPLTLVNNQVGNIL